MSDESPRCALHGTTLDYNDRDAVWFCPERGCGYELIDPYEWDPHYEPAPSEGEQR